MGTVQYPVVPTGDDLTMDQMAEAINYLTERLAQTHGMMCEVYKLVEMLKPLLEKTGPMMGAMSGIKLPPGVRLPGM